MSQRQWKVRVVIEEATLEVAFLFGNEDVKEEVNRILKLLAQQEDPRVPPISSGLDVMRLFDDAPDWYRVKVPRYGIRVIFQIIILRNKRLLPIDQSKPLPAYEDGDKCFIEVMQMGYRKDVYGQELRKRYWKYSEDDD